MELLVHVRLFDIGVDQVENDQVGDVYDKQQFQETVSLGQDGCSFLLKSQKR